MKQYIDRYIPTLLEKEGLIGTRNITTDVKSLLSISCLFQPDGYCIATLWVMFLCIEKPFIVVDVAADDVVVVCDGVNDDSIS